MAASDIYMCDYHLERRGMGRYDWLVPDEENPCTRCATGLYPDWELSADFDPIADRAYEDHIKRLLEKAAAMELISPSE